MVPHTDDFEVPTDPRPHRAARTSAAATCWPPTSTCLTDIGADNAANAVRHAARSMPIGTGSKR